MGTTRKKVNGVWTDVPDRPNGVLDDIRRQNGGKLASELPWTFGDGDDFRERIRSGGRLTRVSRDGSSESWLVNPGFAQPVEPEEAGKNVVKANGDLLRTENQYIRQHQGSEVERFRDGPLGVRITTPRSPMAVPPGTRTPTPMDIIRADIRKEAAYDVYNRHLGKDNPGKKQVTAETQTRVEEIAKERAEGVVTSMRNRIEKEHKPAEKTEAQKAEEDTRQKVGTGSNTDELRANHEAWNSARKKQHEEFQRRHEETSNRQAADEQWIKDFAKQHGLKDPTTAAIGGGKAGDGLVASRDAGLDALIYELEV